MNTETAPAMMAVIAMTMTISISVTPRSRLRSGQGIGCVAHAVAVKNHGGVSARRPKHGHGDQQRIRRGNRGEGLIGDAVRRRVAAESGDGRSRKVSDARHDGDGVVVIYGVEWVGR